MTEASPQPVIAVEQAASEDAAAVYDIQTAAWLDTYPNEEFGITEKDIKKRRGVGDPEAAQQKIERWKQVISNQSDDEAVFVAKLYGKVVGFTAPHRLKDGRFRPGAVYVHPDSQRKGVGHELFQRTLDFMGDGELVVHVASNNQPAINFYKQFGFIENGPLKDGEGVDPLPSGAVIPELEMLRPAKA